MKDSEGGGRQREERRRKGTVTEIDTLKIWSSQQFSQSVSQSVVGSVSAGCAAEHLNREMSSVLYVSDAPLLTGADKRTGWCAVESSLSFRSRKIWSQPT